MDAPAVSIVVPAYNAETTIDDCVRSLLRINHPLGGAEIIVVDNNSIDSTPHRLERYAPPIRILEQRTRGSAAARNLGIVESRGKIVAFTDADCTVEPDWTVNLITPLTDPSVGASGGRILAREDANWIEKFGEVLHDHRRALETYRRPHLIGMNFATRRAIFDEVGLFDIDLIRGQDADLGWRIHAAGYEIRYCHEARVRHLNEDTVLGLFRDGVDHGRAQALLRTKHFDQQRPLLVEVKSARKKIVRYAVRCVLNQDRRTNFCELIYASGKLFGDLKWSRRLNHHFGRIQDRGRMKELQRGGK